MNFAARNHAPSLGVDALDTAAQLAGDVTVLVAALDVLAFVMEFFTLSQAKLKFGAAVFEIDLKRDEGLVAVAHLAH